MNKFKGGGITTCQTSIYQVLRHLVATKLLVSKVNFRILTLTLAITMSMFWGGKVMGQNFTPSSGANAPTANDLPYIDALSTSPPNATLAKSPFRYNPGTRQFSYGNYSSGSYTYPLQSLANLNFLSTKTFSFQPNSTSLSYYATMGYDRNSSSDYFGLRFMTNDGSQGSNLDYDAMFIDGFTTNIGIGNTSPKEALHINRTAQGWSEYTNNATILVGPYNFYRQGNMTGAYKSSGADGGYYFADQTKGMSGSPITDNGEGDWYAWYNNSNHARLKTMTDWDVLTVEAHKFYPSQNQTTNQTGIVTMSVGSSHARLSGSAGTHNDNSAIQGYMAVADVWNIHGETGPNNDGDGRMVIQSGNDGLEPIIFQTYCDYCTNNSPRNMKTQMMTLHPNGIVSVGFPVDGTNWTTINNKPLSTTATNYLLVVNDGIAAKDFHVTATPWADYVFDKDYKLMSLKETEDYIKTNHHLPEIPTTQEVKENGVNLGEMQAKILKKVEELTLHIIELKKENEELKALINK